MISIDDQLREVWKGGWSVFFRKIRTALKLTNRSCLYLVHAFWVIPVLFAMRVLRPLVLIRVGSFHFERIGHFVADVGQRKAESIVVNTRRVLDFWYLPDNNVCSNIYWAQITRRWFRVYSLVRYLVFWNRFIPFGLVHSLSSEGEAGSRDTNGFLQKAKLRLPVTLGEAAKARIWMNQFGWKEGDPFVCLLVRDSTYLSKQFHEHNWDYHSYRDSDIKTYTRAMEYLTSQGIYVFRMGKEMASKACYSHPKFIDYAFRKDKSDFLDIWLFANCSLCITTGSGPDMVSDVFRRPLLALNFLPLQFSWSWSNAIHYPKFLRWTNSGSLLSLKDHLSNAHLHSEAYVTAGIDIEDLTEQQIRNAVEEALEHFGGIPKLADRDMSLQKLFREILISHPDFQKYHSFFNSHSRISMDFLEHAGDSFFF